MQLHDMETALNDSSVPLKEGGAVSMNLSAAPRPPDRCNTTKEGFLAAVETTKEHIRAGDVFQLVLSQRFERSTYADPFDIYRSLRIVNPSPYMVYLQVSRIHVCLFPAHVAWPSSSTAMCIIVFVFAIPSAYRRTGWFSYAFDGHCMRLDVIIAVAATYTMLTVWFTRNCLQGRSCILVASSPEILCRVDQQREVTNRPLAGTRKRGATEQEDRDLEEDLLADAKERAEHIMLVDLGRNDVGRVAEAGSVNVEKLMEIERYSHVMHISSTVKGMQLPVYCTTTAVVSGEKCEVVLPALICR